MEMMLNSLINSLEDGMREGDDQDVEGGLDEF
jgi:hypothetical protein